MQITLFKRYLSILLSSNRPVYSRWDCTFCDIWRQKLVHQHVYKNSHASCLWWLYSMCLVSSVFTLNMVNSKLVCRNWLQRHAQKASTMQGGHKENRTIHSWYVNFQHSVETAASQVTLELELQNTKVPYTVLSFYTSIRNTTRRFPSCSPDSHKMHVSTTGACQ